MKKYRVLKSESAANPDNCRLIEAGQDFSILENAVVQLYCISTINDTISGRENE